jgi:uncharacterized protein YbdZ (MbtH family)
MRKSTIKNTKQKNKKNLRPIFFKVSHKTLIANDHYLNYGTWRVYIALCVTWKLLLLQRNVSECLSWLDHMYAIEWGWLGGIYSLQPPPSRYCRSAHLRTVCVLGPDGQPLQDQ